MRIGIFVSEPWGDSSTIEEVRDRARRTEELGFASGWVPYLPWSLDALACIQAAGEATERLELGSAVIPTYFSHPLALARQAATVQAAVGRPIHLGIGCSNEFVIAMHGLPYEKPAKHTREYLEILMPALHEGAHPKGKREQAGLVQFEGEFFKVGSVYGAPGTTPMGSVLVGALGPHMLRVAGQFADGTIATWSNPTAIKNTIAPAVREAAAKAERPAPRVGGVVPVVLTDDPDAGRAHAREQFGQYEMLPRYRRMMDLGEADTVADVCIVGNAEQIEEQLDAFRAAGMTDLLAAPLAFRDAGWAEIAEALAPFISSHSA
ncbi:MAG: TIGR03564 family F420-dependent LLM class oxidoreductase [Myxococcota bacterium]